MYAIYLAKLLTSHITSLIKMGARQLVFVEKWKLNSTNKLLKTRTILEQVIGRSVVVGKELSQQTPSKILFSLRKINLRHIKCNDKLNAS